jgi:hypothetical protein
MENRERRNEMKRYFKVGTMMAVAVMVATMMGCAAQTPSSYSGFLEDYPPFEAGQKGVDQRYLKAGVDFKNYRKILMDEVVFFFKDEAAYKGVIPSEIKELSDEFHKAFVETLGGMLTDKPGPGVARMRVAVTQIETSNPAVGTISTVVPVGLAVSLAKKATTGEYTGVGSASMEAEFLDSVSNERIAAVIDKAPGGKMDLGKLSAAKSAFKFWAERLQAFLQQP